MSSINEQDTIVIGLKNILSKQGKNIFYNTRKAKSILSDCLPGITDAEKRLLDIAIESGVCQMILEMSYGDEQYIYGRAKSTLINDNYISETAATMTVDRFFLAAGKKIPQKSYSTTVVMHEKKSDDTTVVMHEKKSEPNSPIVADELFGLIADGYVASIEQLLNKWGGLIERFQQLAEQPWTETERLTVLKLLSEMSNLQERYDKIQLDANMPKDEFKKFNDLVSQMADFIKKVDKIESDIYNNLPTTKNQIVASWQICQPNVIFYLDALFGRLAYMTKACLEYKGKEYVIANLCLTTNNFVFVVDNAQLVLETDMSLCAYLLSYCKKKGISL